MSFRTKMRNLRQNPEKQKRDARFREHDNGKLHVISMQAEISDITRKKQKREACIHFGASVR